MTQNLISLTLNDQQLAAVDQSLTELEAQLIGLVALNKETRRALPKMGVKSESFCRETLSLLEQNPQVVPPSMLLAEAIADLQALDRLRPRLQRLKRLFERAVDTEMALGSDVMSAALQGYALLKVAGRNQGLEALRKGLGTRFAKATRQVEEEEAPPVAQAA